ncbi:unnamed protein product [Linum trigynum]|uniref:Uncharacterized protein n=1 Tax=Linum trigynum TaxID=586398 RepID=A0AAV2F1U2_9ROSI
MERWRGVLKVPLKKPGGIPTLYRVSVSLYLSNPSETLAVPSANAILFLGDRVSVTRSTAIQRLSDPQKLADILVSKFGDSINAWVIEAALCNGPFAVYKDCIPTVNQWGEPKSYDPSGFPASNSTASLLTSCLHEIKLRLPASSSNGGVPDPLPTYILGFSKGGTVVNQLVTELSCLEPRSGRREQQRVRIIPESGEDLLSSITEVHYVDVGLNSAGAYVTDHGVIERIGKRLNAEGEGGAGIRFVLHGTPRQWCDDRRAWIREEKDELIRLLEIEAGRRSAAAGKLQVRQKLYFADRVPDMEMHFEVLEAMDVSCE